MRPGHSIIQRCSTALRSSVLHLFMPPSRGGGVPLATRSASTECIYSCPLCYSAPTSVASVKRLCLEQCCVTPCCRTSCVSA